MLSPHSPEQIPPLTPLQLPTPRLSQSLFSILHPQTWLIDLPHSKTRVIRKNRAICHRPQESVRGGGGDLRILPPQIPEQNPPPSSTQLPTPPPPRLRKSLFFLPSWPRTWSSPRFSPPSSPDCVARPSSWYAPSSGKGRFALRLNLKQAFITSCIPSGVYAELKLQPIRKRFLDPVNPLHDSRPNHFNCEPSHSRGYPLAIVIRSDLKKNEPRCYRGENPEAYGKSLPGCSQKQGMNGECSRAQGVLAGGVELSSLTGCLWMGLAWKIGLFVSGGGGITPNPNRYPHPNPNQSQVSLFSFNFISNFKFSLLEFWALSQC